MLSFLRVRLGLRVVSCPLNSDTTVKEQSSVDERAPVPLLCGCSVRNGVLG